MDAAPIIVALDFETANYDASSACALGLVRIENWGIQHRQSWLIRPPSDDFVFTYIHGLTWDKVRECPTIGELWGEIAPLIEGAHFLAAHNAPFDRGVLKASLAAHGIAPPPHAFIDTVQVARKAFKIFPTKLNNVCEKLNIQLNHHEAMSDALACAEIMLRASEAGWRP